MHLSRSSELVYISLEPILYFCISTFSHCGSNCQGQTSHRGFGLPPANTALCSSGSGQKHFFEKNPTIHIACVSLNPTKYSSTYLIGCLDCYQRKEWTDWGPISIFSELLPPSTKRTCTRWSWWLISKCCQWYWRSWCDGEEDIIVRFPNRIKWVGESYYIDGRTVCLLVTTTVIFPSGLSKPTIFWKALFQHNLW